MKVAILSESPADEAALRIVVDGILGVSTTAPPMFSLRSRGWPSVRDVLPAVLKHLHYRTDASALVMVADANGSPRHESAHRQQTEPRCRLCVLTEVVQQTLVRLRPLASRSTLLVALGVAAPAIEAWYAGADDPRLSEATLPRRGTDALKRELKQRVYGTYRPTLELETERARAAASRICQRLPEMMVRFPSGFGTLVQTVAGWREPIHPSST